MQLCKSKVNIEVYDEQSPRTHMTVDDGSKDFALVPFLSQIDGHNNSKLQSVFVDRFPICTAHFSADGEQVIMASMRPFFQVYDMIKGEVIKIPGIRGT